MIKNRAINVGDYWLVKGGVAKIMSVDVSLDKIVFMFLSGDFSDPPFDSSNVQKYVEIMAGMSEKDCLRKLTVDEFKRVARILVIARFTAMFREQFEDTGEDLEFINPYFLEMHGFPMPWKLERKEP
ncbi:MAG: hypothetical protein WCT18_02160 [Patescibacteria group bacterium]